MADTVNTSTLRSKGRRHVLHLTNESDGTGESAVTKLDISTQTTVDGAVATYSVVEFIEYSVPSGYVVLEWAHTANDEIAVLAGNGVIDFTPYGGKVDPKSTGGTGDIVLTTDGFSDGDAYDITIQLRLK